MSEAKPIFVEIQEDGNIDLDLCEEELKKDSSIKAIYVVHFSGNAVKQEKAKISKRELQYKNIRGLCSLFRGNFGNIKAGSCENSDCSIFIFSSK